MLVRNRGVDHACPALQGILQTQTAPRRPKALRTPQHMNGVPGLSPSQRKKLLDSKTIRYLGTAALRHVLARRGQFPDAARPPMRLGVGHFIKANGRFIKPRRALEVPLQSLGPRVDACRHEKTFSKSSAFGCNSAKIQALEARCNHSYKHQSIAGVKEQGVYLSTLTAEYPPSLALQLAGRRRTGQQNGLCPASIATALRNNQDDHLFSAWQAPDLRRSRNALVCRLVPSRASTPTANSGQALAALDA